MRRGAETRLFFATLLLLLGMALLVGAMAAVPAAKPTTAAASDFAAGRAWLDIAALVEVGPRPVVRRGRPELPAHRQAADRLFSRLLELGLSPVRQREELCRQPDRCWPVENLLGRLEPTVDRPASDGAIVLLSHYDSVAAGPGAGDAASGVATILEIVRALQKSGPRNRPLIVVLDDGEEVGLLGAQLFLRHRWAREAAIVLNFEARGTGGQTAMFETSARSLWLVEAYGQAVARPLGSSLIASLYTLLPNDTDLTVTKRAGLLGLNFAFADADWNYHTAHDDLGHLDPAAVQHMGDQGLAVARALLGRPTLTAQLPSERDGVWFDLLSRWLVVYRSTVAGGLALLVAAVYVGLCGLLLKRGCGRSLLIGGARFAALLVVVGLAGQLPRAIIGRLATTPQPWRERPLPTFVAILAAALLAGVAVLLARWGRTEKRPPTSDAEMAEAIGMQGPLVAAAVVLTWRVVGTSYLFTLPALATLLPLLGWLRWAVQRRPTELWLLLLPGLLTTSLLWFTTLRVVRVMVGAQLPIAISLCGALGLAALAPLLTLHGQQRRGWIAVAAAIVLVGALGLAIR